MAIYSGFSHWKGWFSIVMLSYQRVSMSNLGFHPTWTAHCGCLEVAKQKWTNHMFVSMAHKGLDQIRIVTGQKQKGIATWYPQTWKSSNMKSICYNCYSHTNVEDISDRHWQVTGTYIFWIILRTRHLRRIAKHGQILQNMAMWNACQCKVSYLLANSIARRKFLGYF